MEKTRNKRCPISNIEKEKIIMQGFVRKSDIQKLMDWASWDEVTTLFNDIQEKIIKEKKHCHSQKVLVSRVLNELGLSEDLIHKHADLERRFINEKILN